MDSPLTPKVEQLIQERLRQGGYRSATEVIEEALVALEERENRDALIASLDAGDDDMARGDFIELDADHLDDFVEGIKQRGQTRLSSER